MVNALILYSTTDGHTEKICQKIQSVLEQHGHEVKLVSVNVVARKPGKNQPDSNPYIRKFLKQSPWQPDELAVFAGKIDYQKYRFFDRLIIRLIMYITNGPAAPETVADFTNWQQVEVFGRAVSKM